MDFFSLLPILIFIYAVSTVFGSGNKKGQKQRPTNRPQGSQPRRNPPSRQESKTSRRNWRDMFEELEQELFPKEIQTNRPTQTPSPSPYSTTRGYEQSRYEDAQSGEGSWGSEGRAGVEGGFSSEGTSSQEGTAGSEGNFASQRSRGELDKTAKKSSINPPVPSQQVNSGFSAVSQNPLVQGVIWAEVLGKPRGYNKMAYKRRS